MVTKIDLNSDLGEHPYSSLDEHIMPYISSCNIACGGHTGDETSVRKTIRLAKKYHVAIGAHPSYPDRLNFGRQKMTIPPEELSNSIKKQLELVLDTCQEEKVRLHHVKPHGALYNEAATDPTLAHLICQVMKAIAPGLPIYGLAHSVTEKVANKQAIPFIAEAFADRAYEPDKTLRSRSKKHAVIAEEQEVLKQVEELTFNKRVLAQRWISIDAQTICLHSDTEGAVNLARKIRNHLESEGAIIAAV